MAFAPQQAILSLGDGFFDPVRPARFPQTILRFRNDRAAASVGLDGLSDAEWIAHFGRFEPLPGSLPQPLALRYHGHQFRVYNPEIGDGRGFLFAQMTDDRGRLMDFGTKGSGQTPYSRFGDGRLTLKGGVREILATEMLEALGVETSRSFSLIETGEALHRGDEPSPTRSSVLVRLSHGHIRIGAFQRLAAFQDLEGLRTLTAYVLQRYFGEGDGPDAPARLLAGVVARTARMAGRFMGAGFVHGVLNSDNINVTGESFDYGPWRFTPSWAPHFVAAYFDQTGLYAFGRQAEAIYWDAMQLAISLRLIAEEAPLIDALEGFADAFHREQAQAILWRMGLAPRDEANDRALAGAVERALQQSGAPLDSFYFDVFGGQLPDRYGPEFDPVRGLLATYRARKDRSANPYWRGAPQSMLIDEVESIWSAIADRDDWGPLHAKVAAIRAMGQALA
ncbi:protein adenylyltransferase SelO family protein [Sphingomonas sp. HT-1]|uniref:protein adenylyltransferase SelO family protein n=1 Tax=unclassified Sphingomonas TaxID=196159 RepID=UPI00030F7FB8|nr:MULTISPECIES: YdiU family protein [unclassified Sphingomonas]